MLTPLCFSPGVPEPSMAKPPPFSAAPAAALEPCALPPFGQSLFVLQPVGRLNVWVDTPVALVSCAVLSWDVLGHQATNHPLATLACTLVPSARTSVTPVTPVPTRP